MNTTQNLHNMYIALIEYVGTRQKFSGLKRGPHRSGKFLHARNNWWLTPLPRVNESDEQKKVASLSGELSADTWTVDD